MRSDKLTDCHTIKPMLSPYIDEELINEEIAIVEKHLETCEKCSRDYNELLQIKEIVKRIEQPEVDSQIPVSIFERIDEQRKNPEVTWFPITIRIALLLAILVNIGIFSLFRNNKQKLPNIPAYKPIKVENLALEEKKPGEISVSFSIPHRDSLDKYTPPRVNNFKEPTYPEKFFSKNVRGTVVLNIEIDNSGVTKTVKMIKSLSYEADSLAIVSAGAMKFSPAKLGTLSVKSNITATFIFKI